MRLKVLLAILLMCVGLILYRYWDLIGGSTITIERTVRDADARALWERFSTRYGELNLPAQPDTLHLFIDLDDDGVIAPADSELKLAGVAEWIRIDDSACNGRTSIHDRTSLLDDDLQLVIVQLPEDVTPEGQLQIMVPQGVPIRVFASDWLVPSAEVIATLRPVFEPLYDAQTRRLPLWLSARPGTPVDKEIPIQVAYTQEGSPPRTDTLALRAVDGLGHPHYFAAVRDYLMERDRADMPFPKLFLDSIRCPSSAAPDQYEIMRLVAMRHEATKMTVLETFHDRPRFRPRIKDIFGAAKRNPDQNVIVNGNYFHVDTSFPPHGRTCLGAVIHDSTVNPATDRHWWFTYPGAGRSRKADWYYTTYCLVQEEDRCGNIELREEPLDPNPYIPMVQRNHAEVPAHMALGGINTVHDFVHSVGGRKSHLWLSSVRGGSGQDHTLVCLAMSDTIQSTSYYGGQAFRQMLRDSGLVIEEGDPSRGVPPGRCDLAYLDGGASIAMAINVDGEFEFPTYTARHEPRNRHVHVNNYLMFSVECD